MMRKDLYKVSVFAALAAVALVGCYEDWGTDNLPGRKTEYISFTATMGDVKSEATTRHAGHLSIEQEEWTLYGDEGVTRTIPKETSFDGTEQAGLVGFVYDANSSLTSSTAIWASMNNAPYSISSSGGMTATTNVMWSAVGGSGNKLDVYAYSPYNSGYSIGRTAAGTHTGFAGIRIAAAKALLKKSLFRKLYLKRLKPIWILF